MKAYNLTLVLFIGVSLLFSCSSKQKDSEETPYNPYVEAFTSGKISRYNPICLIFNQAVAEEKRKTEEWKKRLKIKPDVAGEFQWENERTLVFQPQKTFERGTEYRVTADLSEWFPVEGKDQKFTFKVTTLPLMLRAQFQSLNVRQETTEGYNLIYDLFTPDREDPETVESLVALSEKAEMHWQHSPDGKRHTLTLANVQAGIDKPRTLSLRIAPNKAGVKEEELQQVTIPSRQDFSVWNVVYVHTPERFVEVTFTKNLDPEQEIRGLAFLAGNQSETVSIEGNKLRLYPDAERTGAVNIHINKGIRSQSGLALKEDVTRQVQIDDNLPAVRFVGNGVIIPEAEQLSVPFRAVSLRGVIVRVIRIQEQNIGQFLQNSQLDENGELMRVGRLIARKTIFLDEEGLDLTHWNTFALDLKQLIEPEPGAIYRVDLSFDRDLSLYPCSDSTGTKRTKEQILADDPIRFKEESSRFDEGGYYYQSGTPDWSEYNWRDRNNPCTPSYYFNVAVGKNVLATNLGLIAKAGADNKMLLLVHDIRNTQPEEGVKVEAFNFQRQLLGEAVTDSKGEARLPLTKGMPFYLVASKGKQRSYLRVDDGSALSLSSFDVAGETIQKGIKGFIYGERGVWRPGDTLHLSVMLNDRLKQLPAAHPVILELYNPMGQLYARKVETKNILGLYTFNLKTEADAPTGAWNVKAEVGGVSFSKRIRIESIKPNRLKIDLTLPQTLLRNEPLNSRLHVEWLQGAMARNLKYEIRGTFISTTTQFKGYKGFQFDDPSRTFQTEESQLATGTTDASGNALVQGNFTIGSAAPGMLLGNLVTQVYEESGDFSIDGRRLLYSPYRRYAGIRSPQEEDRPLSTGKEHRFEVASVSYDGKAQAGTELEAKLYKVNWFWWWSSNRSDLARYVSDSYNKPLRTWTLRADEKGRATFPLQFKDEEWGTYFIVVQDKESRHSTGLLAYFDLPGNEGRRDANGSQSATMLNFKTDKENYRPGEKMSITFPSSSGSRAVVSIENGSSVLSLATYPCKERETTIQLEVTPEMQPNAYIHITLLQPYGAVENDLPIRLYGIVPVGVDSPESHLKPLLQLPKEIKPESDYTITVSEQNGKDMAYTLAVVDEGLLDLTRFATPDPWKAFHAREALGVHTWDLYNYIVGAYGGRIEQLFSIGGDDALNRGPKATANRFPPIVQFAGPFLLKKGERQSHTFRMPNYNGRVRAMVIAGNGDAYGCTERTALVRKPVMILGTLPRVIGTNEEMTVPATLFATEENIGKVEVTIRCSNNMQVVGNATRSLQFTRKEDRTLPFQIRVKDNPGIGTVTLTASAKGESATYSTQIEIRSIETTVGKTIPITLNPGESWQQQVTLPGTTGSNHVRLETSTVHRPLNLATRLSYLADYPHACLEQTVSRAFPRLYLQELSAPDKKQLTDSEEKIEKAINRLRSYRTAEGAFAYWPGQTTANAWGTAYTFHFLLAAEAKGYLVPEGMKQEALNYLRKICRTWKPVKGAPYSASEEQTQAYRLYLLALANNPELGAMNRLKEENNLQELSRWLLGGAYAWTGRNDVALELIRQTAELKPSDLADGVTFGSRLRDDAIRLQVLCLLKQEEEAGQLAARIASTLSSDDWLSTQETAYALIAFADYQRRHPIDGPALFSYTYNKGKEKKVSTTAANWSTELAEGVSSPISFALKNDGASTLFANLHIEGIQPQGEVSASSEGLSLAISYVSEENGRPIHVASLPQGTNFTAVATVMNPTTRDCRNLVLTQLFPAGWEILNTRFLPGKALADPATVSYQDIRDDRVHSYIDHLPAGRQVTVRIRCRAVYPGKFYLPPVTCEAMYDHRFRANSAGQQVRVEL